MTNNHCPHPQPLSHWERGVTSLLAVLNKLGEGLLILAIVILIASSSYAEALQKAADFSLKSIDGKTVTLSKYKGKVVLLNFWATWCPPCREEMPSMQKLHTKMQKEKFQLLAVNIEKTSADNLKAFMAKNKYTFPVLMDPIGLASSNYGVVSIPMTFVINKKGYIVNKVIGSYDWASDKVVSDLKKLAKE